MLHRSKSKRTVIKYNSTDTERYSSHGRFATQTNRYPQQRNQNHRPLLACSLTNVPVQFPCLACSFTDIRFASSRHPVMSLISWSSVSFGSLMDVVDWRVGNRERHRTPSRILSTPSTVLQVIGYYFSQPHNRILKSVRHQCVADVHCSRDQNEPS